MELNNKTSETATRFGFFKIHGTLLILHTTVHATRRTHVPVGKYNFEKENLGQASSTAFSAPLLCVYTPSRGACATNLYTLCSSALLTTTSRFKVRAVFLQLILATHAATADHTFTRTTRGFSLWCGTGGTVHTIISSADIVLQAHRNSVEALYFCRCCGCCCFFVYTYPKTTATTPNAKYMLRVELLC